MFERSCAEINLQIIKNNLKIYKSKIPFDKEIMAVVKADAYGHGEKEISKYLFDNGINFFAVSNIDEAISIRQAGVGGQILVLGYTPLDRTEELFKYDITQTLLSEDYADKMSKIDLPIKCQFAIDTGMRRIGLNADDPFECENTIRKYASKLNLVGLFTHLCVADTPDEHEFSKLQIIEFEEIVKRVEDLELLYCHCLNSAGGLWQHSECSCFVRLGIILYGLKPDYMNVLPEGIKPVLSWKSIVSMVKEVKPGDTIGYGRSFRVNHPMRIATIPTGYADGYPRLLSNKGWVLINSKRAPILGRVCMDQMMVDVTDIPNVDYETEVVLIGQSGDEVITADDLANLIGTIGYEIVCGINKRVKRIIVE